MDDDLYHDVIRENIFSFEDNCTVKPDTLENLSPIKTPSKTPDNSKIIISGNKKKIEHSTEWKKKKSSVIKSLFSDKKKKNKKKNKKKKMTSGSKKMKQKKSKKLKVKKVSFPRSKTSLKQTNIGDFFSSSSSASSGTFSFTKKKTNNEKKTRKRKRESPPTNFTSLENGEKTEKKNDFWEPNRKKRKLNPSLRQKSSLSSPPPSPNIIIIDDSNVITPRPNNLVNDFDNLDDSSSSSCDNIFELKHRNKQQEQREHQQKLLINQTLPHINLNINDDNDDNDEDEDEVEENVNKIDSYSDMMYCPPIMNNDSSNLSNKKNSQSENDVSSESNEGTPLKVIRKTQDEEDDIISLMEINENEFNHNISIKEDFINMKLLKEINDSEIEIINENEYMKKKPTKMKKIDTIIKLEPVSQIDVIKMNDGDIMVRKMIESKRKTDVLTNEYIRKKLNDKKMLEEEFKIAQQECIKNRILESDSSEEEEDEEVTPLLNRLQNVPVPSRVIETAQKTRRKKTQNDENIMLMGVEDMSQLLDEDSDDYNDNSKSDEINKDNDETFVDDIDLHLNNDKVSLTQSLFPSLPHYDIIKRNNSISSPIIKRSSDILMIENSNLVHKSNENDTQKSKGNNGNQMNDVNLLTLKDEHPNDMFSIEIGHTQTINERNEDNDNNNNDDEEEEEEEMETQVEILEMRKKKKRSVPADVKITPLKRMRKDLNEGFETIKICSFCRKNFSQPNEHTKKWMEKEDISKEKASEICGHLIGSFRYSSEKRYIKAHHNCMVFTPGVYYEDKKRQFVNVIKCVDIARLLRCKRCKKMGATIKCIVCEVNYHFPCAVMSGALVDYDKFTILCYKCRDDDDDEE